jgi:V8-like Glu-specific endopeptidase
MSAARSVARIAVGDAMSSSFGTGWLIGKNHIITNWHVVAMTRRDQTLAQLQSNANEALLWFDYYTHAGQYEEVRGARVVSANEALDYAILEVPVPAGRNPLVLASGTAWDIGMRLNIPQHPQGAPMRFGIRENLLVGTDANGVMHYITDTEAGSSGAPVCNDAWEVVALHRATRPLSQPSVVSGRTFSIRNEGVLLSKIVADLDHTLRGEILAS